MTFIDSDDTPTRSELAEWPGPLPICPMSDLPCLDPHCARTGCEAEREDELR